MWYAIDVHEIVLKINLKEQFSNLEENKKLLKNLAQNKRYDLDLFLYYYYLNNTLPQGYFTPLIPSFLSLLV